MPGFGKRKRSEQTPPPTPDKPAPHAERPAGTSDLSTVIVRRSAVTQAADPNNAYGLVEEVINFVNAMSSEGLYNRFEISAKAMAAYHADYYLGQVNNGGHSQFIHNCHSGLHLIMSDVRAGLTGMNATAHLSIFEQVAAWVAENADEASKQTGFEGGRAQPLDELDTLFYQAEKTAPMIPLSARWIASWPELKGVEDADYPEAIRASAMMNPRRKERMIARSVAGLHRQMTDWLHVGAGLACANMSPREFKLAIGGGSAMDVEGEQQLAFYVRTSGPAPRFCVVTKEHAAAYERVEVDNPPMPALGDVEGMKNAIRDGQLARFKGPTVGRKLSHVKSQMIAGVIELANEYRAPEALDLLLRKAGIDPNGAAVTPMGIDAHPKGAVVNWLLAVENQAFFAMSVPGGSVLLRGEQKIASVRKAEIDEYALSVEAVEDKPA